ncbi:MAG TPA: hypothetical protein VFP80_10310 [Thermoanaerobaculia bacterium]|nr:hypothetical protein [Thermoanaerobaculia bacterium]
MSSDPIYTFHASAIALGGVVNNPSRTMIPSLASVALAPTGGLGTTVVTSYDRDGVRFDTAYSAVRGEMIAEDVYSTVAEVAIDNLTVFDTLHVDALRASVRSRRDLNGDDDAEITFHAEYAGLFVNDFEIAPQLDLELFEKAPTYEKFLAEVTEVNWGLRKKAKKCYRERFEWRDGDVPSPGALANRPVRASVARSFVAKPKLPCCTGYTLSIPKFGRIRLGEVVLKPGQRRLSLLQIDFNKKEGFNRFDGGSTGETEGVQRQVQAFALESHDSDTTSTGPHSGTITIASVEGNGTPIWPKN